MGFASRSRARCEIDDITGINALDRVVLKFRHHGIPVEIIGMNEATATMVERLGTHDKPGAVLAGSH